MKTYVAIFIASCISVLADSSTNSTGELEAGAVVGIILGCVFGVALIGSFVMYWLSLGPSWFPKRMPMTTSAMPPMAVESKPNENHMPMIKMPVSGDDGL